MTLKLTKKQGGKSKFELMSYKKGIKKEEDGARRDKKAVKKLI